MKISLKGILSDPVAPLIGAIQGFLVYYLTDAEIFTRTPLLNGLLLFVLAAPATYLLSAGPGWRPRDAIFSVMLGIIPGGLIFWLCHHLGPTAFGHFDPPAGFIFAVAFLWLAGTALGSETHGHRMWAIPYPALFNQMWRIIFTLLIAAFFVAITWVIFFLWAALFKLIQIDIFDRIIKDEAFIYTARGALYAVAVALLRDIPGATEAPQRFILATFRLLAPVLAFFAILFLAALTFSGFDPLWQTGEASAILLSVGAFFVIFVNGYVGDGNLRTDPPRPVRELLRGMMILLPIYPVLAFYALGLRIADYSLTPPRAQGALYISIALVISACYAVTRLRRTGDWRVQVAAINKIAIFFIAIFLPLTCIPGIDPVSLSARTQLARIQNGAASLTAFDLGYLKYGLRKPGQEAFAEIEEDPEILNDPATKKLMKEVAKMTYAEWQQSRYGHNLPLKTTAMTEGMVDAIATYPSDSSISSGLAESLKAGAREAVFECANRPKDQPMCMILMLDFNQDGRTDAGLWNGYTQIEIFTSAPIDDNWTRAGWLDASGGVDAAALRDALTRGEVKVVRPLKDDLMIGDTRFE